MRNIGRHTLGGTGRQRALRQRGLSIVELMVGITISLFILAGASLVLTTQLDNNRRLLLEAQVQQDLRTTADMISRDVRRAGFWGRAYCQIWPAMAPEAQGGDPVNCPLVAAPPANVALNPAQPNPYARFDLSADGTQLVYDRSTDFEGGNLNAADDHKVDDSALRPREAVGFKFDAAAGTIAYWIGNSGADRNWQALTDPAVIRVTQFTMTLTSRDLPVPVPCGDPVTVQSRDLTFTIVAQAVHDASVQRSLTENVRLRNSVPVNGVPALPCP